MNIGLIYNRTLVRAVSHEHWYTLHIYRDSFINYRDIEIVVYITEV